MKHLAFLITIICLCSVFSCTESNKGIRLTSNSLPAEIFLDMFHSIEQCKNDSIKNDYLSTKECVLAGAEKNKRRLIDSLLKQPVYHELSKLAVSYLDSSILKGKNAYYIAFSKLPYDTIPMNGNLTRYWCQNIDNSFIKNSISNINYIENNIKDIERQVNNYCVSLLPNYNYNKDISLISCIDGNRGSFAYNNNVVLDFIDSDFKELDRLTRTIAHECHHIVYNSWLADKYKIGMQKREFNEAMYSHQRRIIMEGLAQQINFSDYPSQVKELYNNRQLIKLLFDDWSNMLFSLKDSEDPLNFYKNWHNNMWKKSEKLLHEFVHGKINKETIPRRPTVDYYISYHLYKCISDYGGRQRLRYVINNPEFLLEEYNRVSCSNSLIPKIPNDVVDLWKNNFM